MAEYRHLVSGFFVKRDEAQIALSKLKDQGIAPDQLGIYDNETVVGLEDTAKKEGKFADMVQEAIMNGQVVLVVQTRSLMTLI